MFGDEDDAKEFVAIGIHGVSVCAVLALCLLINYTLHRFHISWLPESVAAMFLGAAVGFLIVETDPKEADILMFDPSTFFFVLLPPIILQAGYSLKKRNFFKNISAILLYAVFGTIITAFGMGLAVYYGAKWAGIQGMRMIDALVFGTVLSATESVAVLSLLGKPELNADPMLHSLVFGESVFNDAVSIVLFDVLTKFQKKTSHEFRAVDVFAGIGSFFGVALGSIIMGSLVALLCCFLMKRLDFMHHPAEEFLLVFLAAFSAYCSAEIFALSGVMSLFFAGIVLAHYNWYNLSKAARASTRYGFAALSVGCETFVFVYLGLTFSFSFHQKDSFVWSPKLVLVVIGSAFATRLYVFPFSFLDNLRRPQGRKITLRMQTAIWFVGMRGSVAFALALNIPGEFQGLFVTTTLAIVAFSLLFCGFSLESVVKKLGLVGESRSNGLLNEFHNSGAVNLVGEGDFDASLDFRASSLNLGGGREKRFCSAVTCFKDFDRRFMKPTFGGNTEDKTYMVDRVNNEADF